MGTRYWRSNSGSSKTLYDKCNCYLLCVRGFTISSTFKGRWHDANWNRSCTKITRDNKIKHVLICQTINAQTGVQWSSNNFYLICDTPLFYLVSIKYTNIIILILLWNYQTIPYTNIWRNMIADSSILFQSACVHYVPPATAVLKGCNFFVMYLPTRPFRVKSSAEGTQKRLVAILVSNTSLNRLEFHFYASTV